MKLEKGKTVIYVNEKKFLQCKYLLIEIPRNEIEYFEDIASIDEVSERLDHSLEKSINGKKLTPEIEYWGHCSNLQTWVENLYDTTLLHSSLAFPLLKKLTDVGDPIASKVFKEEISPKRQRIIAFFGFTALVIGIALIFLIIYSMLFGYK